MNERQPITTIENGTCYYVENGQVENPARYEGKIEIYDHWVRLAKATGNWVPRNQVEQVHEI